MRKVLSLLTILAPLCVFSQTAQWATLPTYDAVEDFVDDYRKIYNGALMGIATLDGKEIVPAKYDHITSFVDGYALALNKVPDSNEWQISAIIQRGGMEYIVMQETFYNTKYSYFSCGRLLVKNKKGLYGYLDVDGNVVVPCKYRRAYPFSDGLASVVEKELHYYITPNGRLAFRPSGRMYREAFSFHNGTAVVYVDGNTKVVGFVINKHGQEMGTHDMNFNEAINIARKSKNWSLHVEQTADDSSDIASLVKDGVIPYSDNGKWGYKKGDNIVLLPQFEKAESFAGGFAKVKKDGKWGILRLCEGSFYGSLSKDILRVVNSKPSELKYTISIPEVWKGKNTTLVCRDGDSSTTLIDAAVDVDSLILDIPLNIQGKEKQKNLYFTFSSDNLLLWEDMQTVSFSYPISLKLGKPITTQDKADEEDKIVFWVTIENPSEETVTTNVDIDVEGHEHFEYTPKSVTINANRKTEVGITLNKVVEEKTVKIIVRLSDSRRTKIESEDILLKPFY